MKAQAIYKNGKLESCSSCTDKMVGVVMTDTLRVSTMKFNDCNEEIGSISFNDGIIDFKGNATDSATAMFNSVVKLNNSKLIELEKQVAEKDAVIAELKSKEAKAFWWASEFTHSVHNGKIQKAWEDFKGIFND